MPGVNYVGRRLSNRRRTGDRPLLPGLRLAALPGPSHPQPAGQSDKIQSGHGRCCPAFGVRAVGGSSGGSAMGAGDRHAYREVPRHHGTDGRG
jgi:hypothetical protein